MSHVHHSQLLSAVYTERGAAHPALSAHACTQTHVTSLQWDPCEDQLLAVKDLSLLTSS